MIVMCMLCCQPNVPTAEGCAMLRYWKNNPDTGYAAVNTQCSDARATIYEHVGGCSASQKRNGTTCVQADLCQTYVNLCAPYLNSVCEADATLGYKCICPVGLFFRNAGQDRCQACSDCPAEFYGSSGCSGTLNRQCSRCLTCPSSNYYESTSCTTTSNRICQACRSTCTGNNIFEATPCTTTSNRVCQECRSPCPGNTFEAVLCNATSDRVCQQCQDVCSGNTFETASCTNTSDRVCSQCETCPLGFSETIACSSQQNRVCQDTTPPSLVLLGDNPYYLEFGQTYLEPGAAAEDRGASITSAVIIVVPTFGSRVSL
jgi:hypothetical protein